MWRTGCLKSPAHNSAEVSRRFIPAFSRIQEQLTNSSGSCCCQKPMHNAGMEFQRVFVAQAATIFYNLYATGTFLPKCSFRSSSRPAEVFVSIITVWMGSGSWPSMLKSFCSDRWDRLEGRTVAPSGDLLFLCKISSEIPFSYLLSGWPYIIYSLVYINDIQVLSIIK